jgi:hypothetical protein
MKWDDCMTDQRQARPAWRGTTIPSQRLNNIRSRLGQVGGYQKQHAFAVAKQARDHDEEVVALCHDLMEDGFATEADLRAWGLTERQLAALKLLTRREEEGQTYAEYIDEIVRSGDELAMAVKVYDLYYHLHPSNIHHRSRSGVKRYIAALETLSLARARQE